MTLVVIGIGIAGDAGSQAPTAAPAGTTQDDVAQASTEEQRREAEEQASIEAAEEAERAAAEEAERAAAEEAERAEEEARRDAEVAEREAAEAALLDPDSYEALSDREWAQIERDPDAHIGERYVLYGHVVQFDSNTGPASLRAMTSGEPKSNWYDYEINTLVETSNEEIIADVVTGDLVTLHVEIIGAYSYSTTMGGFMTAPQVQVNIVSVDGSV